MVWRSSAATLKYPQALAMMSIFPVLGAKLGPHSHQLVLLSNDSVVPVTDSIPWFVCHGIDYLANVVHTAQSCITLCHASHCSQCKQLANTEHSTFNMSLRCDKHRYALCPESAADDHHTDMMHLLSSYK